MGQLQLAVLPQGDGTALAGEKPVPGARPVHHLLQGGLPRVEGGLSRLAGGFIVGCGGFFQNRQELLAELLRHGQQVRVKANHLTGGAQQPAGADDVVRQGEQVHPLPARQIGEAESVAPLDELTPRWGQLAHSSDGPVPAPGDNPVGQIGQGPDGPGILGGQVEGVQPRGQPGFDLRQLLEHRQGEPPVPAGQLHQVDVAGEQALHGGKGGQARHIPRRNMEQHPQGPDLRAPERPGAGETAQLQIQPGLQGLPADLRPDPVQLLSRPGRGVLGNEAVQRSAVQFISQGIQGVQDGVRLQGRAAESTGDVSFQAAQDGVQLPVGEEFSSGENHGISPFPSSSAAPAAQVVMSFSPARPRMVRQGDFSPQPHSSPGVRQPRSSVMTLVTGVALMRGVIRFTSPTSPMGRGSKVRTSRMMTRE